MLGELRCVAGIVGETVVGWAETKIAPFLLAILCLGLAFAGIWKFWVSLLQVRMLGSC